MTISVADAPASWTRLWPVALLLAAAVALVIAFSLLPMDEWLRTFGLWVKSLGPLAYVAFALFYIVATIALVPGGALTIAAGVAFGWSAIPLVLISATIGATGAFLVGRYLARDEVRRQIAKRPKLQAVADAIDEGGWRIVALFRLSPAIPFNIQNYIYGVTGIPLAHYVAATGIGIIPGTIGITYIGIIGSAAGTGMSNVQWALLIAGFIATVAATIWITILARRALARQKLKTA